jgi:glycosyltransferase EpsF
MNKIKVLHVITCFGMGGAETWLLELLKLLQADDNYKDVSFDFLLVGGSPGDALTDEVLKTGANIYYIDFNLGRFLDFRNKFISLLRKGSFQAIHSHLDFISGWVFLAGFPFLPKHRVSHLHNPIINIRNYLSVSLHRYISFYLGRILTYLLTTKLTGTSNQVMREYGYFKWPYKKKNIGAIYCGFNPTRFYPIDLAEKQKMKSEFPFIMNGKKIAIFVGRIDLDEAFDTNQKNPDFAFAIAKELVLQDADWCFIFIGKIGLKAQQYQEECAALGISDKIFFLGIRKDVHLFMGFASILVFPALSEGLGMVAVECQAAGTPVLVSDQVPIEAKVVDGLYFQHSLIYEPKSWVKRILEISQNASISRDAANQVVLRSNFHISHSLDSLISIYQ